MASGTGYQILGAGPDLLAFESGPNPSMRRFVVQTMPRQWAPWSDPNAPASSEAGVLNAYRLESGWRKYALAVLAKVGEEIDANRRFHVPEPRWLDDALAELAAVDDEIEEDGLPQVSESTKAEAERIIKALAWRAPALVPAPTVYPTQDAEVALHFKAPGRSGTVVILLSDGVRADCHAYVGGRSRRAHYQTSLDLPDAFILDQLRCLTPPSRAAVSTPAAGFLQFGAAFLPTNPLPTW